MANEQPTQLTNKAELADILYNAFVKALETNDVKLNQRNKLEEVLKKEISNLGKITEKEEAKIREVIQNGFKKGNSVQSELQKYFKDIQKVLYNNEKNRIQGLSRSSVVSSYPKTEKVFQERENRIRRTALSRYNRLNSKLDNTINKISGSNSKLSESLSTLSGASRKLESLTNALIQRTDKISNNMSWLESATKSISDSSKKTSKITNSLITQSIRLDKDASWAEQSVNSLKNSSKKIKKFFKKGQGSEGGESGNDVEQDQDDAKFINKLVKKLESSKLGGVKNDIFRFVGALIASKMPGHPFLQMASYMGMPLLGADMLTGFKGTRGAAKYGGNLLAGLTKYVPTKVLGKMGPLGEAIYGAGMTRTAQLGSKLIPGLGAAAFGVGAYSKFKKGDKVGGVVDTIGAVGSVMAMIAPLFGPAAPIVAGIGEVAAILAMLYDLFKPAKQFIVGVFGGLWKWLTGLQGKGPTPVNKPSHPWVNKNIVQPFQHSGFGKKLTQAALALGGWNALHDTPLSTTGMSRQKLLSTIGKNKYFEKLTSGTGYSIATRQMTHDIPYARSGTNAAYQAAFANIFSQSKYAGLKGRVQMTGALGTKASLGIHNVGTASHFTGTKQDWQVMKNGKYDPEGTKLLEEAFASTGMFSRVASEATHGDVQVSKSTYNKYDTAVKEAAKKEEPKSKTPQTSAGPSISYANHDLSGNTLFERAVLPLNYMGRDTV